MKIVKQTAAYTVFERGDGRYAVRGKDKKWINGEAKIEILVAEGLLKKDKPKARPKQQAEESAAGETAGGAASSEDAGEGTDGHS